MRLSLDVAELAELIKANPQTCLVDVRKPAARAASGLVIPNSHRESPFEAETWWQFYASASVVVYCVHGHEVSQGACHVLRGRGIEARYLDGGFEAWREAGMAVEALGEGHVV
jgi:thiosulfate sulfurtransferase